MIILICGLPNAGKTTYSKNYSNVIHLDDFLEKAKSPRSLYNLCNEAAAASENKDVCVQGVYALRKQRINLLDLVKDKQDKKICIWIDTPIQICKQRENRNRSEEFVESFQKFFKPPTFDQGWDEIIQITNK